MRAHHRAHATGVLRAKLHETALTWNVLRDSGADAQDVVACWPFGRELEDLAIVHIGIIDGQKGAGLGQRMLYIGTMMRHEVGPVASAHLLGVNGVRESEVGRRWSRFDARPLAVQRICVVGLLAADLGDKSRVLRPGRRRLDSCRPFQITLPRIGPLTQTFDDALLVVLGLNVNLEFFRRGRRNVARKVLIQRLPPQREVLLELVARHE